MVKQKLKILALIPARSGSKGIPDKNIKLFNGKPLIAWSIDQAKASKYEMRIVVSTDSAEYAAVANKHGAETPFLRPAKISQDLSIDIEFIYHAVEWLKREEGYVADIIVQLRPTQPCRSVKCLDECLDIFVANYDKYDSLRTVYEMEKSPYKMYTVCEDSEGDENGEGGEMKELLPLFKAVKGIWEPYNQCRQALPKCYLHNGYIDILKTSILERGTISGERIYPYIMSSDDCIDIDTVVDWEKANKIAKI